MPQAVVVAGITAAGTLGAAHMANRSNRRAIDAQTSANDQALAYQREQDSKREMAAEKAREQYKQAWKDYYGMFGDEAIKRYGMPAGISLSELKGTKPDVRASGNGYSVRPQGMAAPTPSMAPMGQQPQTLSDLSGWSEWKRYGVGA